MGYEKRELDLTQYHANKNDVSGYNGTPVGNIVGGNNIFEDNFYIDSVERYNVKYKPPPIVQQNSAQGPH